MSKKEVTCSQCHRTYVPSISFDFYRRPTPEDPNAGVCESCLLRGPDPVEVSDSQAKEVCKFGSSEKTCAFLAISAGIGFVCVKKTNTSSEIRYRLENDLMNAKGNNCSGPPNFEPTPN